MDAIQIKRQALLEIGDSGKDAFYELDLPLSTTGGDYTITFSGQTTDPIPFNATREQLTAALTALTNVGANNVEIFGVPGGPYRIRLKGELGGQPLPAIEYPMTGDGQYLVPATQIQIVQREVGRSPVLTGWAETIYLNYETVEPERLRFLYLKRDLIDIALGESQKGVDDDIIKTSQQHKNILALRALCDKEISNILNPVVNSGFEGNGASAVLTGRITKRTPNGLPYGQMGFDPNTRRFY